MRTPVLLVAFTLFVPAVVATGLLPVDPIVNGDFDLYADVGLPTAVRPAVDRCVGVGHQAYDPIYSPWAAFVVDAAGDIVRDPAGAPALVSDPAFAPALLGYPAAFVTGAAADPDYAHRCDARHREVAEVNAWGKSRDRGFHWSNDPATAFRDFDGDGDQEAVVPSVPAEHHHNLWQTLSTTQAFSADFDAFTFTLVAGDIPPAANVQIGFSLSPGYAQHPYVGVFWEGAVLFRADDMVPDEDGRVALRPVHDGEIVCPDWPACRAFKTEYAAASDEGKAALLAQARIVQTSFWRFNSPDGPVVLDDVGISGSRSAAETPPHVAAP